MSRKHGSDYATQGAIVLVVDDQPRNIQLVGSILSEAGYEVMPALSGEQAFARMRAQCPDLVLLDMMMPGMDGFEVCKHIRRDALCSQVPVIFLTAAGEREFLVRAFESGAVDYLTKPVDATELLLRVRTHLELKLARDAVERVSGEREEVTSILAHDLKNPLTSIRFGVDMLTDVENVPPPARRTQILLSIREDANRMIELIARFLDRRADSELTTRLHPSPLRLDHVARLTAQNLLMAAQGKRIELVLEQVRAATALADPEGVGKVVENLVSNAVKFSPPGSAVDIDVHSDASGFARLSVLDRGPGISEADREKLFQKYVRLSARPTGEESSTGLGLAIAKQLAEQMGGRLWYEDRAGGGACFCLELPALTNA
ncbi:MAG: hybrid sensor histidine kinase/response regulator [Rhodanobacteraceae bacterium]